MSELTNYKCQVWTKKMWSIKDHIKIKKKITPQNDKKCVIINFEQ